MRVSHTFTTTYKTPVYKTCGIPAFAPLAAALALPVIKHACKSHFYKTWKTPVYKTCDIPVLSPLAAALSLSWPVIKHACKSHFYNNI